MSTDARGELIKGARPNAGELHRGKRTKKADIPTPSTTERNNVVARLKAEKPK